MGWTKEDKSFKKLIDKRASSADFKFYEEFGDSTLDIQFENVKTDPIPFNNPIQAINDGIASAWEIGTEFTLIEDTDASSNKNTWYAGVTAAGGPGNGDYSPGSDYDQISDWISDKNGPDYSIHLYQSNGSEIFLTDPSNWIFDYPTGILTFGIGNDDGSVGGGFNNGWATPLKITGYNYIGAFGGAVGGGEADLTIHVTQTGVGIGKSNGQVLALPDDGTYVLANATDDEKVAVGIITNVIDDNNLEYQDTGIASYTPGGLIKGNTYYLDVVDGGAINIYPTDFTQPVFVATETNEILINIEPMFVYEDYDFTSSVIAHYTTIDLMIAGQVDQVNGAIYYVADATVGTITDSLILSGYVYYEYLGTTFGDLSDYKIIAAQQSIVANQVTLPSNEIRVSADHGNDATGEMGKYFAPFLTIEAASSYAAQLIVNDPGLTNKILISVESGDYLNEKNIAFKGNMFLHPGVFIKTLSSGDNLLDSADSIDMSSSVFNLIGYGDISGDINNGAVFGGEVGYLNIECNSITGLMGFLYTRECEMDVKLLDVDRFFNINCLIGTFKIGKLYQHSLFQSGWFFSNITYNALADTEIQIGELIGNITIKDNASTAPTLGGIVNVSINNVLNGSITTGLEIYDTTIHVGSGDCNLSVEKIITTQGSLIISGIYERVDLKYASDYIYFRDLVLISNSGSQVLVDTFGGATDSSASVIGSLTMITAADPKYNTDIVLTYISDIPDVNQGVENTVLVNQTNIGITLIAGDIIALSGNTYVKANGTDDTIIAIGVVVEIISIDELRYQDTGQADYTKSVLTKGTAYYLDITDGNVIDVEPDNFVQTLFVAIETDKILINIGDMFVFEYNGEIQFNNRFSELIDKDMAKQGFTESGDVSGIVAFDMSKSNFQIKLIGDITGISFINLPGINDRVTYVLSVYQDAVGSRTMNWVGSGVRTIDGNTNDDLQPNNVIDSLTQYWMYWDGVGLTLTILKIGDIL